MQQRYYDPIIGRFISNDPIGWVPNSPVHSFGRYTYANNNPYKYTDPDGQFAFLIPVAIFIAKEIVAEVASQATGGATDFLSARRMAKKGITTIAKKIGKGKCCFVAGTQVLTENGYKNIENIKLGEKLWAKNVETGEQNWKSVTKIFVEPNRRIFKIKLVGEDGFVQKIEATDDHPFYVIDKGWRNTIELTTDDLIETDGYGLMKVVSVIDIDRTDLTYNFTVADFNTYYVTKRNVLVHNCNLDMKPGGLGNSTRGSDDKVKETVDNIINSGDKKAMECASCKLGESLKTRRADQKRQTDKRNKAYQDHKNRIKLEQKLKDKLDRNLKEND